MYNEIILTELISLHRLIFIIVGSERLHGTAETSSTGHKLLHREKPRHAT